MTVATEWISTPAAPVPHSPTMPPDRLATVTALRPPSTPAVAAPLRLTRRGVVAVALLVGLLGVGLIWLGRLSAPAAPAGGAAPRTVTVQQGDTLWSIADRVAPHRDPRAEVAELERRNDLAGAALVPGQVLRVR